MLENEAGSQQESVAAEAAQPESKPARTTRRTSTAAKTTATSAPRASRTPKATSDAQADSGDGSTSEASAKVAAQKKPATRRAPAKKPATSGAANSSARAGSVKEREPHAEEAAAPADTPKQRAPRTRKPAAEQSKKPAESVPALGAAPEQPKAPAIDRPPRKAAIKAAPVAQALPAGGNTDSPAEGAKTAEADASAQHGSFAPKGTSRTRSTTARTRKPPASAEGGEPAPAAVEEKVAATAADASSEQRPSGQGANGQSSRSQRRRTSSSSTQTHGGDNSDKDPTQATPAQDPIGEALSELGRTQQAKRTQRSTSRVQETTQDEVLEDLAHVIAGDGGEQPEASDDEEGAQGTPRRRHRRRGGRNRRRSGNHPDEVLAEVAEEPVQEESEDDGESDTTDDEASTHRRRRRRRRGEEIEEEPEEDTNVVVKVRDPHAAKKTTKTTDVTGIDGSTRIEAKKQRRREGRAASRRRAPVLSEAEFLARRESVERKMLIRQKKEYSQIAVIEDGVLVEHYVDRASATSLIGNIYLGKIQNVLPGMEAAFVDIGRGRNAVLYAGEVDWDSFGEKGQTRKIEDVFTAGQLVLVQVSKDPVGAKGARLTAHISIPGRYVVYAPQGHLSGVSRKLSDTERLRLKGILDKLIDDNASVVIRTAAEGATEEELVHDVARLKAQWEVIDKKAGGKQAPQLLYSEPDLTMRIVRDLFTEDFGSLIVDGNGGVEDAYEVVEAYVQHVAPHLVDRIQRWDHEAQGDLFAQYRIDEQIAKALDRKVHLPSGGSLVIDRTEAMTVIDVNTGKFTGSGGNLEATVTANNLEAAEEIVRQLRLRDIGGIIIVDFIDMVLPSNRELLLRRLVECLGRDRTRHQVSEVTSLGLVQLTRKKVGTGLAEAFTKVCEACNGEGHIRYEEPVDTQAPADGGERHHNPQQRNYRRKN